MIEVHVSNLRRKWNIDGTNPLIEALRHRGYRIRIALRYSSFFPRLLENAMRLAYDYVFTYRRLHLAALCDSAAQRLAQVLSQLATGKGHRIADGMELHIGNEELANEAHVTVFTVSRQMREWQQQGLVRKGRGRVVVRKPDALLRVDV